MYYLSLQPGTLGMLNSPERSRWTGQGTGQPITWCFCFQLRGQIFTRESPPGARKPQSTQNRFMIYSGLHKYIPIPNTASIMPGSRGGFETRPYKVNDLQ